MFDRLAYMLTKEALKQSLEEYFTSKVESLTEDVYPPMIQDIWQRIPSLSDKIEVVPFVKHVDPSKGIVKLGWNMFVLGVNRMYLGESQHQSMQDLATSISGNISGLPFESTSNPKQIIDFVMTILDRSEDGIELPTKTPVSLNKVKDTAGFVTPSDMARPAGAGISGKFYGHSGSGYQAGL